MFRRFSVNFALFSILLDGILVGVSLAAAVLLRAPLNQLPFVMKIPEPVEAPWVLYAVFPLIWVGVLLLFSTYDGRKNLRMVDEFGSLTLASLLAMISMAGVLYLSFRQVSRFLFLFFVGLAYLLLLGWRLATRLAFRWNMLNTVQRRRVLIVGAGEMGRRLQAQIEALPYLGLVLVGFLDDEPKLHVGESGQHDPCEVLGGVDEVRSMASQKMIDDVVIALPRSADQRLNQLVAELHDMPVKVWIIPDYYSLALHRATVEEFAGIPMLDLRAPALSEYQRMVKRAFDLTICTLALPLALPVIGIISLFIRRTTPGPAFYRARRVGESGRLFEMIKFRTMVENADQLRSLVEEVDEGGHILQHKSPNDPRVTPVGRFLRRTSLDELPNIFNVFRGDMSLVGPRPELPYLVEKYELWQRKRFAVPQGITGWWQINGRSDKPMHLHTEEDLYYVQHYSLWLDLQILLKTAWVVLRGKGAY
jgi:exopolysaccharide biosynthesis polyprenyl glycosylphosphotransferase